MKDSVSPPSFMDEVHVSPKIPAAHLVELNKNEEIVALQIHLMLVPNHRGHLLDDIIPFHHIMVSYRCANGKLLRTSPISETID
jgi:hypothetical protein